MVVHTNAGNVAVETGANHRGDVVPHTPERHTNPGVGEGFEWLFMPNWSMKVEWLHYDLGNVSFVAPELQAIGKAP